MRARRHGRRQVRPARPGRTEVERQPVHGGHRLRVEDVFTRSGTSWSQQAYVKASNTRADAHFGEFLALSGDTLAVSSIHETSNATGVNGSQADALTSNAGAVYV